MGNDGFARETEPFPIGTGRYDRHAVWIHQMDQESPFPISVRLWNDLAPNEQEFFYDDDLPLHPNHAAQIGLLVRDDASRVIDWAFASIPSGWPDRHEHGFKHETRLSVFDCWNDPTRGQAVRRWLFDRGVPFRRTVFLLYERNRVIRTSWRMVIRYWRSFAWDVGYAMIAVDRTLQWACCFHHEDVFVFGSNSQTKE